MTIVTTRTWLCPEETDTSAAGREIAQLLPSDAVVHLVGDLGAGKTFLARAIATALGADPREVSSPTFAIVHEYPTGRGEAIIHIDAYRLSDRPREWFEIGIPEMLGAPGVKLIEWPKAAFAEFEEAHVEIRIKVRDDDAREIVLELPDGPGNRSVTT